jgi:hypothetical protein
MAGFYAYFGPFAGVWFAWLPIQVILGSLLDPWVRYRWVFGMSLAGQALSCLLLTVILWTSKGLLGQTMRPDEFRHIIGRDFAYLR